MSVRDWYVARRLNGTYAIYDLSEDCVIMEFEGHDAKARATDVLKGAQSTATSVSQILSAFTSGLQVKQGKLGR